MSAALLLLIAAVSDVCAAFRLAMIGEFAVCSLVKIVVAWACWAEVNDNSLVKCCTCRCTMFAGVGAVVWAKVSPAQIAPNKTYLRVCFNEGYLYLI